MGNDHRGLSICTETTSSTPNGACLEHSTFQRHAPRSGSGSQENDDHIEHTHLVSAVITPQAFILGQAPTRECSSVPSCTVIVIRGLSHFLLPSVEAFPKSRSPSEPCQL